MFDWTEARLATLRQCIADRKSSGYAAKLLGDEAGVKLSRNAVVSKAKKFGLRFNSRADPKPKPPVRRRRRTRHSEETLAKYAGEQLPPVPFVSSPEATEESKIPLGQRKTLLELTGSSCRWPFGDPQASDFFFCGGHVITGAAYCTQHCRVAYSRASTR